MRIFTVPKFRPKNEPKYKQVTQVCVSCGKRRQAEIIDAPHLPLPNTTSKIIMPGFGLQPGSWLACKLGSHDWYFEWEVEP